MIVIGLDLGGVLILFWTENQNSLKKLITIKSSQQIFIKNIKQNKFFVIKIHFFAKILSSKLAIVETSM